MKQNKYHVITTFYNVENYIKDCINSVKSQNYKNYVFHLFDDCSTDKTTSHIVEDTQTILYKSDVRKTALENIVHVLQNYKFSPDDIIVLLDGDDMLLHNRVFDKLNSIYKDSTMLTYGQHVTSDGRFGFCRDYTEDEFENIRTTGWYFSHLRTFRYSLWTKLVDLDPDLSFLKDDKGEFYKITYDVALFCLC